MRFQTAICALAAGIFATATAAPLTEENRLFHDSFERTIIIPTDMTIPSATPAADETPSATSFFDPVLTIGSIAGDDSNEGADSYAARQLQAPEVRPLFPVAAVSILIAFFGMYQLNYKDHRRRRRGLRALTVLR